jgi:hypothetical protein
MGSFFYHSAMGSRGDQGYVGFSNNFQVALSSTKLDEFPLFYTKVMGNFLPSSLYLFFRIHLFESWEGFIFLSS